MIELLRDGVSRKLEGYVLKDPAAPYTFERTNSIQKIKLLGPDVNVGVVGLGFSLTTNPRRWGIATGLLISSPTEDESAEESANVFKKILEYYCRTEVLQGDNPSKAFRIIYQLKTRVRVKDILSVLEGNAGNKLDQNGYLSSKDVKGIVRLRLYNVFVVRTKSVNVISPEEEHTHKKIAFSIIKVEWKAIQPEHAENEVLIQFPADVLLSTDSDIEWLCSPYECPFSLSLHGDIRPLDSYIIRNPVARLEFVDLHNEGAGAGWDTRIKVQHKFEEAVELSTCVEMHSARRLIRLRAAPSSKTHLEEVRRTAMAWVSTVNLSLTKEKKKKKAGEKGLQAHQRILRSSSNRGKVEQGKETTTTTATTNDYEQEEIYRDEVWPQLPPSSFTTINGASDTISNAYTKLCAMLPNVFGGAHDPQNSKQSDNMDTHDNSINNNNQTLFSALCPLSIQERKVLADLPPLSQWDQLLSSTQKKNSAVPSRYNGNYSSGEENVEESWEHNDNQDNEFSEDTRQAEYFHDEDELAEAAKLSIQNVQQRKQQLEQAIGGGVIVYSDYNVKSHNKQQLQ